MYQLSKDAAVEIFDDGGLVLFALERCLVELNPTALEVLQLLDSGKTIEEIGTILVPRYEILPGQAKQDVQELCNGFVNPACW